jgi:hypothetical protein
VSIEGAIQHLGLLSIFCLSIYRCCSHVELRASVKRFVSLQFLNLRQSVGLLGRGNSPTQGRYLHRTNEHRITQTNIHAFSGIGTHDPSVRAGEDSSCLRSRGHRDRLFQLQPHSNTYIQGIFHWTMFCLVIFLLL